MTQLVAERAPRACGCFTPPAVDTPVVQAGERIVFRVDDGVVTAHIQIAFSGKADEFGWLLPLPSVPSLQVGVDAMFAELESRTVPRLTRSFTRRSDDCAPVEESPTGGRSGVFSCGNSTVISDSTNAKGCRTDTDCGSRGLCVQGICVVDLREDLAPSVAVAVDSVGPYDYAVLKADDSRAMLDWLQKNRFYVPSTSDAALRPYIHPGAYFLALKLRSGRDTGDLQPIVVRYASDQPMIPLILTSVGAVPDMSVEAFVLGDARAVPRNYYHAVLDEAALWMDGADYNSVFRDAVHTAPGRHAFVTEYAASGALLRGWIPRPTVNPTELQALTRPADYATYLDFHNCHDPRTLPQLVAILRAHIPEPAALIARGLSANDFYSALAYWAKFYERELPGEPPIAFDPVATTADLMARFVEPLGASLDLFEGKPWLTRLRTVLSPEDMTADPVFGFNPELPRVSQLHAASDETACRQRSILVADPDDPLGTQSLRFDPTTRGLPAALRIERLPEEGKPESVIDNGAMVRAAQVAKSTLDDGQGCAVGPGPAHRGELLGAGLLLGVAALLRGPRRRRARGAGRSAD